MSSIVRRLPRVAGAPGTLLPLLCMVATLASAPLQAGTQRIAVLVANHDGGEGLEELRYSARDAERLRDVLTDLGGFEEADILELVDKDSVDVVDTLYDVTRRIAELRAKGERVVFVFYYSGHAQNGVLHLGERGRLSMERIRQLLEETQADVRLAFIDSCGAGAITREKGAQIAPPFVVKVDDSLTARGQVIIASSSADEASQESDDVQGSFFTHYLTTGLRGDADDNGDGKVTLDEAYRYAYGRTVAATAATRSGAQHPTYAWDLHGAGDVVLTQPAEAELVLAFPDDLAGRYFVVDLEKQVFVAEIDKAKGEASRISLPSGQYAIKKRLDTHLLMQRVNGRDKGVVVVDESRMEQVSFEDDYAKGTPIYATVEGETIWSLSVGAGGQWVFDDPSAGNLFPPIAFVQLEGRVKNLFARRFIHSLDLTFGSRENVVTPAGASIPTQYTQVQLGSATMYELPLAWGFSAAAGPRLALLGVGVQYKDKLGGSEAYTMFVPGLQGVLAWQPVDWFHVEATGRGNYLLYTLAGRNLGYLEGAVSVWVDF